MIGHLIIHSPNVKVWSRGSTNRALPQGYDITCGTTDRGRSGLRMWQDKKRPAGPWYQRSVRKLRYVMRASGPPGFVPFEHSDRRGIRPLRKIRYKSSSAKQTFQDWDDKIGDASFIRAPAPTVRLFDFVLCQNGISLFIPTPDDESLLPVSVWGQVFSDTSPLRSVEEDPVTGSSQ